MTEVRAKRRLFAGIALDDATRLACASVAQTLLRSGFDARYEGLEKLHLTLAFLGNVAHDEFEATAGALETAAHANAPFRIRLNRIGAVPHERKPRVVYVGAHDAGAAFRTLSQDVRDAYGELGFVFKGDPIAHVTIARVTEPTRALAPIDVPDIDLEVTVLSLFESLFDPERNTSRYEIAATTPLRVSAG